MQTQQFPCLVATSFDMWQVKVRWSSNEKAHVAVQSLEWTGFQTSRVPVFILTPPSLF